MNPKHVTFFLSISSCGDLRPTCEARAGAGARLAYLPLRCGWSGPWQTTSAAVLGPDRCTHGGPGHGQGSRAAAQGSGQGTQLPLSGTESCHCPHPLSPSETATDHKEGPTRVLRALGPLPTRAESKAFESRETPDTARGPRVQAHVFN